MVGCSLSRLTEDCEFQFKDYKDVLKFIVCNNDSDILSSKCYLGQCKDCPNIEKLEQYLTNIFFDKDIDQISYSQWISTPYTTLKNITDDATNFTSYFCEKIENLLPHAYISKQQSDFSKKLKDSLLNDEIIINLDFAENYAFVVQDAPPGFHWNNSQATVFVAFMYYKKEGELKKKGFVVISDNLTHDTVAVYTYQQLCIEYVKNNFSVKKIHYFSDGAPQQFKNFKNIINICYHYEDFKIEAVWHFFPTAHGKGACDGVGGSVKRAAAKNSLRSPPEKQILTAAALYDWLKSESNFPNIEFRFSSTKDYEQNLRKLKSRFNNTNRIKDLQKQHYVAALEHGIVRHKIFSTSTESKETKIIC